MSSGPMYFYEEYDIRRNLTEVIETDRQTDKATHIHARTHLKMNQHFNVFYQITNSADFIPKSHLSLT